MERKLRPVNENTSIMKMRKQAAQLPTRTRAKPPPVEWVVPPGRGPSGAAVSPNMLPSAPRRIESLRGQA